MPNSQRHEAGPLLSRGRLVTVDGHPVCAACGSAVLPRYPDGWRHLPEGAPLPTRSDWLPPMAWPELRSIDRYRDFVDRYRWSVRPELGGGAVTTEDDWAEGMRRLRDYHARLADARAWPQLPPGENPYLDLARVLAGRRPDGSQRVGGRQTDGSGLAWRVLPGGLRTMLDLPSRRRELAAVFAWAIPDHPALMLIGRHTPLLECGAGTGYWAALLADRGADVLASDISPPGPPVTDGGTAMPAAADGDGSDASARDAASLAQAVTDGRTAMPNAAVGHEANPFHRTDRSWSEVTPLDAVHAVRAHPGRVLLLCWPPFDHDAASYAPLRAYRGDVLLYIGDTPGPDGISGATGTIRFHRELALNWTPAEQAPLPNWPGLADRLVVYRRNREHRALTQRDRCPGCGRYRPTGAIGRCDRCFRRRPPAMALQVNGLRVEYPAEVVAAMPTALRRAFERSPSLLWPLRQPPG